MITQIGFVSGEILTLLDQLEGAVNVENIKFYIDAPEEVILMSLGWLIRERYACAIPRATGIEIRQIGNDTNEAFQGHPLDLDAMTCLD
jgi:hypothetical protein